MAEDTVTYTLEVPEQDWREWADSVPRSKNLDDRLVELIREDSR